MEVERVWSGGCDGEESRALGTLGNAEFTYSERQPRGIGCLRPLHVDGCMEVLLEVVVPDEDIGGAKWVKVVGPEHCALVARELGV